MTLFKAISSMPYFDIYFNNRLHLESVSTIVSNTQPSQPQQPAIYVYDSNLLNNESISELAGAYLHNDERLVFNKRKHQQAQKEYISTRKIIKQYFSTLLSLPFASLSVLFDDNDKLLKVYHDNIALPVYSCISHSHGYVAIALSQIPCQLGIDLELISEKRSLTRVANRYFHEKELAVCSNRSDLDFYRLWTLKEALAKAVCQPIAKILSENIFDYDGQYSLRSGSIDTFDLSIISDTKLPAIIHVQQLTVL